jgi:1-deoxy-D-xylulose-5-phosphate reductoisomerase
MPISSPHRSSITMSDGSFNMSQRLAVLGSTGSIGQSTLDLAAQHPDAFEIVALVAGRNIDRLITQIDATQPRMVCVADEESAAALRARHPLHHIELGVGPAAIASIAASPDIDTVVAAIVGAAGLQSTIAAVTAGKRLALANKESMVVAGPLVRRLAAKHGATILPVDSEHSAVYQALAGSRRADVSRVTLTASGGPFREWSSEQLTHVTVEQALKHPNWSMGAKITIDSATMMNKGLELIEARWLFDLPPEQLHAIVHPESIIHALVEFCDGTVMAQMACPDMRAPIAYALRAPARVTTQIPRLALEELHRLTFDAIDERRFPAFRLARAANDAGGSAPAVLNAANEVAVAAFLARKLSFVQIPVVIEETLQHFSQRSWNTLEEILDIDAEARRMTETFQQGISWKSSISA